MSKPNNWRCKPANVTHLMALGGASTMLKVALSEAKRAGCHRLAQKIRSAIASAGGALRHMKRRLRTDE